MKPKAIDLFSGCGGLTLGLKQAGFEVIGAVEVDDLAAKTYEANHPEVTVWKNDIRDVNVPDVLNKLRISKGELDLLAGCPPCQGFSTMKTLNGNASDDDDRNDLVFEYLRFVKEMQPKALMMENVPGLAKDQRSKTLVVELKELGYCCSFDVLNAADYGVPQRRKRFILLAGKSLSVDFGTRAQRRKTVREAFTLLKKIPKDDPLHNIKEHRSKRIQDLIAMIPPNGGSRRDLAEEYQLPCHKRCDGFKDVYGRMAWDEISPTITGGCFNPSKGRFLHPTLNRAISLREAALLQSFPPDYQFSLERGKSAAAQMIGNALPPEFIRRHAVKVIKFLQES